MMFEILFIITTILRFLIHKGVTIAGGLKFFQFREIFWFCFLKFGEFSSISILTVWLEWLIYQLFPAFFLLLLFISMSCLLICCCYRLKHKRQQKQFDTYMKIYKKYKYVFFIDFQ